MLKKTLLILLPILLLFCFAGTAAADGADGEVESYDYGSDTASADSGAVSLEGSETSSADAAISSEPAVTEEALPAETEMPAENVTAENTGTFDSGSPADEQGNESENTPAADSEPLEGGASDPEGPAEYADAPLEEDPQQNFCDEGEESPLLIDPYFYDAGGNLHTYTNPGTAIQDAINDFENQGGRGLIYVEFGTYNGFTINAAPNLTGIVFHDYNPREASIPVNGPFDPYDSSTWPQINGNVNVDGMSAFTMIGFLITGQLTFNDCTGQLTLNHLEVKGTGSGLSVNNHTGNVVISNVEAKNNTGTYGARIDNSNGGNVTITNSAFNDNNTYGIEVLTNGIVTVNGIDASNNGSYGMKVEDFSRLTINNAAFSDNSGYGIHLYTEKDAPVTISNIFASDNGSYGIGVTTKGAVTVSDVAAIDNTGGHGLWISNYLANSPRAVNINRGSFINNWDAGVSVLSKGAVTLTDISSRENYTGVRIDNTYGTANVTIRSSRAGTAYEFSSNDDSGIDIVSKGVVTISDAKVSQNAGIGVWIRNHTADAARNVTLTRVSVTGNTGNPYSKDGIYISSRGNVLLTDVSSSDNRSTSGSYHGLYIDNRGQYISDKWTGTGSVTIRSSRAGTAYDFSGNNTGCGIFIETNGTVNISDVNAIGNAGLGLVVGDDTPGTARAVTVLRSIFNSNDDNGLSIHSLGAVTLTDVSAADNRYTGVMIDNTYGTANVTIRASRAGNTMSFSDNGYDGINIVSKGVVSISDVNASENTFRGIEVDNTYGAARNFTLTRGTFNDNKREGVFIISIGAVTLTDVSASGNGTTTSHHGVVIDNATGTGNVTVRSSRAGDYYEISGNTGRGIFINSEGTVLVSNIILEGNHQFGAYIQNYTGQPRNVTLTRVGVSGGIMDSSATGYGIWILSKGNVLLTDVSSSDNNNEGTGNFHGLVINNSFGTGSVTVRSSRSGTFLDFSNNNGYGVSISSEGTVTVSDIRAENNDFNGMTISNEAAPSARNVTITRGLFNDNKTSAPGVYNAGVYILSKGAVTLTDVSASSNGTTISHHGVVIYNTAGTGNVTVRSSRATHYSDISGNEGTGLEIQSKGIVTIINVNAYDNGAKGININNYDSDSAPRAVTLTRCNAINNIGNGVEVLSKGAVTLVDVSATHNKLQGVKIDNNGPGASGNVTVRSSRAASYCDFSNNTNIGLNIHSNGSITIRNVNAISNKNTGILARTYIENRTIVLQNVYAHGNTNHGISALGMGSGGSNPPLAVNVTASNVRSYNNGTTTAHSGIYISGTTGRLSFSNCAFIGNSGYGIRVFGMTEPIVTLRNTIVAGNGTKNILF